MYIIRNGAIRWPIPDFLSDGNINVFSISHHLRDILESNKMQRVWPWKWRSRSGRRKTGHVPFYWKCPFPYRRLIQYFSNPATCVTQKGYNTHTHSEIQICLETMQIIYVCLLDIDRGHVTEIELEQAETVTVQSQATLLLHLLQGVYIYHDLLS